MHLSPASRILAAPAMAQDKKLKIGATTYGLNAEFMQIWSAALKQHPAVKSGDVELTVFDGRYDALVQQEQFNTMITQKFDAIIFVPIDVEAGAAAVQAAHDAGIPVVGSNARVNSDLLTSYVGSNDAMSGEMEAKAVLDKMGCKGNRRHPRRTDRPVRRRSSASKATRRRSADARTSRFWKRRPPTGRAPKPRR